MERLRHRRAQAGFTLIELLVVIVILGILSAVVVFAVRGSGDKGKDAAIQTDERTIRTALEVFCARESRYPGGLSAPDPYKSDPMGELVAGKYLSNPSTLTTLSTPGSQGNCPGVGPNTYQLTPPVRPGEAPLNAVALAAAGDHSLAVTADGKVWSWGGNGPNRGNGRSDLDPPPPNQVIGPNGDGLLGDEVPVVAVAAGTQHSLALTRNGEVWAWGANVSGQLGINLLPNNDPDTRFRTKPVKVIGSGGDVDVEGLVGKVIAISAGSLHSLALTDNGTVWAWGYNVYGEVGNGAIGYDVRPDQPNTNSIIPAPVKVVNSADGRFLEGRFKALGRGSLALHEDGTVWGWGSFWGSQANLNSPSAHSPKPVQVKGAGGVAFNGVTDISGFMVRTVPGESGSVWGHRRSNPPVRITLSPGGGVFEGVTATATGSFGHFLARKADGMVWATGPNESGQLGDGTTMDRTELVQVRDSRAPAPPVCPLPFNLTPNLNGPVFTPGLFDGVTAVAVGNQHSVALKQDGTVWAWGNNRGDQLGNGCRPIGNSPYPGSPYPLQVKGVST